MEKVNLNRSSLAEQIAEHILDCIDSGEFKPSTMLPSESALAEMYSVSRPVIREALKALAAQDIICIVRGKGSFVQEMNTKPLRMFFQRAIKIDPSTWIALLDVRRVLEVRTAALAAANRTPIELSTLEKLISELAEHARDIEEDHNYNTYAALDVDFHVLVARASKNEFLFNLVESIRHSLTAFNVELLKNCLRPLVPQLVVAHTRVFEAIRDSDPREAERAMHVHYDLVFQGIAERYHEAPPIV